MSVALALLTAIGLVILKSSLDIMAPRQWVIMTNITDAYLSYEQAYAERVSFDEFIQNDSDYPIYPDKKTTTVVMGKMPGGHNITATVIRTRKPDPNNLPAHGGTGTTTTNPAEMETWQLISHIIYDIGDVPYTKTRTVVRTR